MTENPLVAAERLSRKLQGEAFDRLDIILASDYPYDRISNYPEILRVIVAEIKALRQEMQEWHDTIAT